MRITYAVDETTGLVISRVGSTLAWPILDYGAMTPENGFTPSYHLETIPVLDAACEWPHLHWTRKIPMAVKNTHRQFWGMPALRP